MKSIASLTLFPLKLEKKTSERAELLRYFLEHARNRQGKITPARMGMMLSHFKDIQDLYFIASNCRQEAARSGGEETWNKIFWSSIKTIKV